MSLERDGNGHYVQPGSAYFHAGEPGTGVVAKPEPSMTSTTVEWAIHALFRDGTTYTSIPTKSRMAAAAAARFWSGEPHVAHVTLIKRTIVSEEEAV